MLSLALVVMNIVLLGLLACIASKIHAWLQAGARGRAGLGG
jgi:hypothetical protein